MYNIGDLIITKDGSHWVLCDVGFNSLEFGAKKIHVNWTTGGYDDCYPYDNWEDVVTGINKISKVLSHHPKGKWKVVVE